MSDDRGSLTLALHDYDADPHGDWLGLRAAVASNGFAGQIPFRVSRADLERFAQNLGELDGSLPGNAELVWGAGDQEAIRLRLVAGRSGRLLVHVELTGPPGEDPTHRVQAEFRVMPNALSAFRPELRCLLDRREAAVARLVGDREAAG